MSSPATQTPDESLFREVVGHFTTGVTVVTTRHGDRPFGVTASAVSSLSADPPMLLACLNRRLATCTALSEAGAFAVSILAADQGDLALHFARRQSDKFAGVAVREGELGAPLIAGALAHLECRLTGCFDAGTHTVFVGAVEHASAAGGAPLTYFRGGFGHFRPAA